MGTLTRPSCSGGRPERGGVGKGRAQNPGGSGTRSRACVHCGDKTRGQRIGGIVQCRGASSHAAFAPTSALFLFRSSGKDDVTDVHVVYALSRRQPLAHWRPPRRVWPEPLALTCKFRIAHYPTMIRPRNIDATPGRERKKKKKKKTPAWCFRSPSLAHMHGAALTFEGGEGRPQLKALHPQRKKAMEEHC